MEAKPAMSESKSGIDCIEATVCAIYLTLGFHCGLSKVEHTALIVVSPLSLPVLNYGIVNDVVHF